MNEPVAVPVSKLEIEDLLPSNRVREKEYTIQDEGLDLSSYRGTHGVPFVADYFGIRNLYKTNDEIKTKVNEITEHLINETDGQSIVYAVKYLLDEMGEEMNLKGDDAGIYKLKKILNFIRLKNKLSAIDNMKAKVLQTIENDV
jgi:hypothetical protein